MSKHKQNPEYVTDWTTVFLWGVIVLLIESIAVMFYFLMLICSGFTAVEPSPSPIYTEAPTVSPSPWLN